MARNVRRFAGCVAPSAAFVFLSAAPAPAQTPAPDAAGQPFIRRVVELANLERRKAGLPPLKLQTDLVKSAEWLALDMTANSYFSHTDHQGRTMDKRIPEIGYTPFSALGENIAAGQQKPESVVEAWMKSPGHRQNILSPLFWEVGVAVARPADGPIKSFWVADFGTRADAYPIVLDLESGTTTSDVVKLHIYGAGIIEKYRLRNDSGPWTPWQTYRADIDWTLAPGTGGHTVFAELTDGGQVYHSEDTIEVKPVVPELHASK